MGLRRVSVWDGIAAFHADHISEDPALSRYACCPLALQELVSDCEAEIEKLLSYPLADTVASGDAKAVLDDDFVQVGGRRGRQGGGHMQRRGTWT